MRIVRKISAEDVKSLEDRFYTYRSGRKEGKHVGWRAALDESPYILKWFDSQTNKADALRYLIEQNILENGGIIDLAEVLPRVRKFEDKFKKKISRTKTNADVKVKETVDVVEDVYEEDITVKDIYKVDVIDDSNVEIEENNTSKQVVLQPNAVDEPVVIKEAISPEETDIKTEVEEEKQIDIKLPDTPPQKQVTVNEEPAVIVEKKQPPLKHEESEMDKPKKRSTLDKFTKGGNW